MLWQQSLEALVLERLGAAHEAWWKQNAHGNFDRLTFLGAFSGAGRRFGQAPLAPPAAAALQGLFVEGRPWAEVGRMALLLAGAERASGEELLALVEEAYRTGDLSEKQAVLRTLAHLPAPHRYMPIAAEGARANALAIFEAVACENPYPCSHFSDETLNQLVMKALFNDVPLRRIEGLRKRMNADLVRMARGYGSERRAAGRPISEDLAMLEGFHHEAV